MPLDDLISRDRDILYAVVLTCPRGGKVFLPQPSYEAARVISNHARKTGFDAEIAPWPGDPESHLSGATFFRGA